VGDLVRAFAPIMMFMLVPLWIPLIAVTAGAISDRVGRRRTARQPPEFVTNPHHS
jgi:hypothetical protein